MSAFFKPLLTVTALAALLAAGAASAQSRDPRVHDRGPAPSGHLVLDARYHHDHYYPARGFVAPIVPRGSVSIAFGGGSYWYGGGVWYQPWGGRYRVVMPPVGIIVPLLPYDYVSLRVGGAPYYYANGVYYSAAPGGYVVVNPPAQADAAVAQPSPPPAPARPDPIYYPRNKQTVEQQEDDVRECNRWATSQPAAMNDASVFARSVEACMDGRGYTSR